jgi:hypothetical protein
MHPTPPPSGRTSAFPNLTGRGPAQGPRGYRSSAYGSRTPSFARPRLTM